MTRFDATPPGLIGSGSGVGLGGYYLGPFEEWNWGPGPDERRLHAQGFLGLLGLLSEDRRIGGHDRPRSRSEDGGR